MALQHLSCDSQDMYILDSSNGFLAAILVAVCLYNKYSCYLITALVLDTIWVVMHCSHHIIIIAP